MHSRPSRCSRLSRGLTTTVLTAALALSLPPGANAQCVGEGGGSVGGGTPSDGNTPGAGGGIPSLPDAPTTSPSLPAPRTGNGGGSRPAGPTTGPVSPSGPRGRGRGQPECGITSGGQALIVSEESWSRWWNRHQDEFVWGRERNRRAAPSVVVSGSGTRALQQGANSGQRPLRRGYVYTQVVGPLLEVIQSDADPALRESAILALGEAVDDRFAAVVTDTLLPCLADDDLRIRSAAALGLGLAGDPSALPALTDLAYCSNSGHKLVGGGEVSQRVRTAALLGLGYSGAPEAMPTLNLILEALPDSSFEMKRAAIMALGLMQNERAPQAAAQLAGLLADRTLNNTIKAAVPTALARLGQVESVATLRDALNDRDTDRLVRQSCVIALGQLGSLAEPDLVHDLIDLALDDRDEATRNFATMALARLGAQPGDRQELAAEHAALTKAFSKQLKRPTNRNDRPFFALASGLYLQGNPGASPELLARLVAAYDDVSNPSVKGAYALALGLSGDRSAGRELRKDFSDLNDPVFRAHCALALGLLGYAEADTDLREAVTAKGQELFLTRSLGTALMLLDDPRATAALVDGFTNARSYEHRAGLAQALSAQRHEEVVPALRAAVTDDKLDGLSRASACSALGWVVGRNQLPWRAQLSVGSNFVAASPTVDDLLGMP
ncbi:MAG: hypothetical protein DHS20C15_06870 [Planctomycetota bacterium]|nr:MAG: hypothetical protein DHS20C15_06870 [Planctomycetota bacterium]